MRPTDIETRVEKTFEKVQSVSDKNVYYYKAGLKKVSQPSKLTDEEFRAQEADLCARWNFEVNERIFWEHGVEAELSVRPIVIHGPVKTRSPVVVVPVEPKPTALRPPVNESCRQLGCCILS
ncbi:MAG: hypothetical protein V4489_08615 [Chlamydiota bacterium]